jgi:xanthine dehydrogenase accessory factor
VPGDQLDRVHVPAGLDLGHTTHQEIAVAILAELVQLRASGGLVGASPAAGSQAISSSTPSGDPAEATDPVCGMTVPATPAGRPLAHDGDTYYFCCAGCRQEFEKDPDRYAKKETRC